MACNKDTQGSVEQYFHICEVAGRKAGSRGKPCIVLAFSRYRYGTGESGAKTITWFGPFPTILEAKALIDSRQSPVPIPAISPTAGRKAGKISNRKKKVSA